MRSTRLVIYATVMLALAWCALFFEFNWIDGDVIRDNTPWHPWLLLTLLALSVGTYLLAFVVWLHQRRNRQ